MVISVLLLVLGVSFAAGCDYAQLSPRHTVCVFANPACNLLRKGMYKEEVDAIIDIHNKMRSKVAMGQEPGQPPAANMKQIKWDGELAYIAQFLANQCYDIHSGRTPHDDFHDRESFRYEYVGQNIATKPFLDAQSNFDIQEAMNGFYSEVAKMQRSFVDSYPEEYRLEIGHYSQLMWADTEAVGCGLSKYQINDEYLTQIVCNYGPSGNWNKKKIYEVGAPCSKCTKGCSQKYPGLCL